MEMAPGPPGGQKPGNGGQYQQEVRVRILAPCLLAVSRVVMLW